MRYMLLIYSKERENGPSPEEALEMMETHYTVIQEGKEKGVLEAAEPLARTSSATTIRMENGAPLITDGPFAETKEQLAGYYIVNCNNLDEAIEWAAKIPTGCKGQVGCIEVRPLPGLPTRAEYEALAATIAQQRG